MLSITLENLKRTEQILRVNVMSYNFTNENEKVYKKIN